MEEILHPTVGTVGTVEGAASTTGTEGAPVTATEVSVVEPTNVIQDALTSVNVEKYNLNIFDEVYAKIKSLISSKQFNAGNWVSLVPMCMEMVETVPHLKGKDKQALVIDLITKLICEIPMSESDRAIVQAVLSTALPTMINIICNSSLGEYAINLAEEVHEQVTGCFKKCYGKKYATVGATTSAQEKGVKKNRPTRNAQGRIVR